MEIQEVTGEFVLTRDDFLAWEAYKRFFYNTSFIDWLADCVKERLPPELKLVKVYYIERHPDYYCPVVYYVARHTTHDEAITESLTYLIDNLQLLPNPFKTLNDGNNGTNKNHTCAACQNQADEPKGKYCKRCHRRA